LVASSALPDGLFGSKKVSPEFSGEREETPWSGVSWVQGDQSLCGRDGVLGCSLFKLIDDLVCGDRRRCFACRMPGTDAQSVMVEGRLYEQECSAATVHSADDVGQLPFKSERDGSLEVRRVTTHPVDVVLVFASFLLFRVGWR